MYLQMHRNTTTRLIQIFHIFLLVGSANGLRFWKIYINLHRRGIIMIIDKQSAVDLTWRCDQENGTEALPLRPDWHAGMRRQLVHQLGQPHMV